MAKDRKLNTEEHILWGKVAQSTRPMAGHQQDFAELEALLRDMEMQQATSIKPPAPVSDQPIPSVPKMRKPSGVHYPLERPVKRKIAKGKLALEARIDLHGLSQDEAYAMLLGFLQRAHERGLRHVLVITGKGSSGASEGALKRAVPLWFSQADFRYLISSYETAAQHHGGEGALYVRLSRQRGGL